MKTGMIYLAGPMRGYPKFNFPAFRAATAALRMKGYDVLSPHELDEEVGLTEDVPPKNVTKEVVHRCLRRDMEAIARCGVIALLPGWKDSSGAKLELAVAERIGCMVFEVDVEKDYALVPRKPAGTGIHMDLVVL
jgi:hypothetical protein